MITPIQTARLTLRRPAPRDWDAFRAFMLSDRSKTLGSTQEEGPAWRIFASELGHWEICGHGMWAVTKTGDDTALALIGPWTPVDWPEKEIGWMVLDAAIEGTGIAAEAAAAAVKHAYDVLGWDTVVSYIAPDNTRSIALAERLGATHDTAATAPARYPNSRVYRHPKPEVAA